ncbi:MAG TPA: hypothetical protein VGR07_00150 [Thermoanaerobaculia bacterium]|jgi:hypothetical protein|nr:hypothetical protein [Thermoanaerobaculia bacterium]
MVTDAILDTSILVDLLRAFPSAMDWFASLGRQRVAIHTTNLKHFQPLPAVDAKKPY